jgi:hypothetical protein
MPPMSVAACLLQCKACLTRSAPQVTQALNPAGTGSHHVQRSLAKRLPAKCSTSRLLQLLLAPGASNTATASSKCAGAQCPTAYPAQLWPSCLRTAASPAARGPYGDSSTQSCPCNTGICSNTADARTAILRQLLPLINSKGSSNCSPGCSTPAILIPETNGPIRLQPAP